jgi:hypothetical protein
MHDRTLTTDSRIAASNRVLASSAASRFIVSGWIQTFRPSTLAPLLLAIAVALFSYGYKVSVFTFHPDGKAHLPATKALMEHRQGSAPASFKGLRYRPRVQFDVIPDGYIGQAGASTPVLSSNAVRIFAHPRPLPFFDSALPLRSPPSLKA